MGKTLKICLAMGGGVSLGSFSGSALTEALKLLILYGQDSDGNKYENVVVDGMSGASAGAMALTVMLKALINYKSMLYLLDGVTEKTLVKELSQLYFGGDDKKAKSHDKIEDLKALQVAQKLQEELWVNRLNASSLFGKEKIKNFTPNIHRSFALLDRGLLEKLATDFIIKPKHKDLKNIRVLDKTRVTFACSLTNLLPIEIKKNEKDLSKLEKNLIQSVGSQNHTEIRVIDFVFDKKNLRGKHTDERWLEFSDTEELSERQFDLGKDTAWATMCASVLACGAFPIAFEPVILKRYKEEYNGKGEDHSGQWPTQFNNLNKLINGNSIKTHSTVFNEDIKYGDNKVFYNSFNFPYVDGGTFNNEPIREAFRMGAFQDYGNDTSNTDRLVLFVDPIVRTEKYQTFQQSSLMPVNLNGKKVEANGELMKFIGVTSSLINSLKNQGTIKEEHKISDVKENLVLRNTIFKYLEHNEKLGKNLSTEILDTAYVKIENNLKADIIPLGTRDVIIYFKNELSKYCDLTHNSNSTCLHITHKQFQKLIAKIDSYKKKGKTFDFQKKGYAILGITSKKDKNLFASTVFKIIFDFSLNTDGKNENAERVAILPINSQNEVISLPGEEISAFGGFASLKARQYAFNYGILSALNSLAAAEDGFRKPKTENGQIYPFIVSNQLEGLRHDIKEKIQDIEFPESRLSYQNHIREKLVKVGLKRVVILIKTIFKTKILLIALFGSMLSLILKLRPKLKWVIHVVTTLLYKYFLKKKIDVMHTYLLPVTISIISTKKLSKKVKVSTMDDENITMTMVLNNNEESQNKYQYLFQVYRAPYKKVVTTANETTQNTYRNNAFMGEIFSLESEKVEKIVLTMQNKVELPKVDENLGHNSLAKEIEKRYKKIIYRIRVGKHQLPSINKALTKKDDMLWHSLLNIEYHVNPLLEIDIDKLDKGWYFKENTEAMYKTFLRKKEII